MSSSIWSRIAARVVVLAFVPCGAIVAQRSKVPVIAMPAPADPIVAARANVAIRIDGQLDESVWDLVKPTTSFFQKEPMEGAPATLATDVRMIVTDSAVIIGARLRDDYRTVLSALGPPTDGAAGGYLQDYFEVQIDPHREHLTAFAFMLNPNGGRRASIVSRDGTRDESWNVRWDSSVRVDAQGWTLEVSIPLSEFHVTPGSEQWGVQFVRFSWRRQETDVYKRVEAMR